MSPNLNANRTNLATVATFVSAIETLANEITTLEIHS
jgi:hypothetical protein